MSNSHDTSGCVLASVPRATQCGKCSLGVPYCRYFLAQLVFKLCRMPVLGSSGGPGPMWQVSAGLAIAAPSSCGMTRVPVEQTWRSHGKLKGNLPQRTTLGGVASMRSGVPCELAQRADFFEIVFRVFAS